MYTPAIVGDSVTTAMRCCLLQVDLGMVAEHEAQARGRSPERVTSTWRPISESAIASTPDDAAASSTTEWSSSESRISQSAADRRERPDVAVLDHGALADDRRARGRASP